MGAFHHISAVLLEDLSRPSIDTDIMVVGDDRAATDMVQALVDRLPGMRGIYAGRLAQRPTGGGPHHQPRLGQPPLQGPRRHPDHRRLTRAGGRAGATTQERCSQMTGRRSSSTHDLCEANGVCMGIAPEVFELDDADQLQVHQPYPPADLLDRVEEAVRFCPKNALSLQQVED